MAAITGSFLAAVMVGCACAMKLMLLTTAGAANVNLAGLGTTPHFTAVLLNTAFDTPNKGAAILIMMQIDQQSKRKA
jgi:hypothetical protein